MKSDVESMAVNSVTVGGAVGTEIQAEDYASSAVISLRTLLRENFL